MSIILVWFILDVYSCVFFMFLQDWNKWSWSWFAIFLVIHEKKKRTIIKTTDHDMMILSSSHSRFNSRFPVQYNHLHPSDVAARPWRAQCQSNWTSSDTWAFWMCLNASFSLFFCATGFNIAILATRRFQKSDEFSRQKVVLFEIWIPH